MGSGGFGGSRTLPNTMRTHMDTSWTGYTLPKYFPAVVSAIMWGGFKKNRMSRDESYTLFCGLILFRTASESECRWTNVPYYFQPFIKQSQPTTFQNPNCRDNLFHNLQTYSFSITTTFNKLLNNSLSKTITRCTLLNQGLSKHQRRHCISHFTYNWFKSFWTPLHIPFHSVLSKELPARGCARACARGLRKGVVQGGCARGVCGVVRDLCGGFVGLCGGLCGQFFDR